MFDVLTNIPQILTFVGGAGGVVSLGKFIIDLRAGQSKNAKTDADASEVLAKTAVGLLEPLHIELDAARREIASLRVNLAMAIDALRQHGIPVPQMTVPETGKRGKRNG